MAEEKIAAALLVGGKSSRMGEDKSLLVYETGAEPLYARQLGKLQQITELPILLSVRSNQIFQKLPNNVELITDRLDGQGPLSALCTCLEACKADWLLVLAVDLPQISTAYLKNLVSEAQQKKCGIIPQINGHWEPLAAVYPRTLLNKAQAHLKTGQLSLQKFIREAIAEKLLISRAINPQEEALFTNLNTPEDLKALKQKELHPFDIQQCKKLTKQGARHSISSTTQSDLVAVEEPIELKIEGESIAVLMRTPGHDRELAAGFLLAENVIHNNDDLFEISECQNKQSSGEQQYGQLIDVLLRKGKTADLDKLSRHVLSSSSCGVCGKTSIESIFQSFPPIKEGNLKISAKTLLSLPAQLNEKQSNYQRSGGLHASAIFTADGELLMIREDIGRHNALDKIIGAALLDQNLPLLSSVLLLSGRISFELMQKALAAGIPIVAGISAPSSLAVKFARESGQTLVGFLRDSSFNIYSEAWRIDGRQQTELNIKEVT